jgi:hypothetical protein
LTIPLAGAARIWSEKDRIAVAADTVVMSMKSSDLVGAGVLTRKSLDSRERTRLPRVSDTSRKVKARIPGN